MQTGNQPVGNFFFLSFSFVFCNRKNKPHFIRVKKVEAQDYKDETSISNDVTLDLYASAQKEICKLSTFHHLE